MFRTPTGRHILIDLKSGDPERRRRICRNSGVSRSGIGDTFPDEPPIDRGGRYGSAGFHPIPYTIIDYAAPPDAGSGLSREFLACLTVFHEPFPRGYSRSGRRSTCFRSALRKMSRGSRGRWTNRWIMDRGLTPTDADAVDVRRYIEVERLEHGGACFSFLPDVALKLRADARRAERARLR